MGVVSGEPVLQALLTANTFPAGARAGSEFPPAPNMCREKKLSSLIDSRTHDSSLHCDCSIIQNEGTLSAVKRPTSTLCDTGLKGDGLQRGFFSSFWERRKANVVNYVGRSDFPWWL